MRVLRWLLAPFPRCLPLPTSLRSWVCSHLMRLLLMLLLAPALVLTSLLAHQAKADSKGHTHPRLHFAGAYEGESLK